MSWERRSADGQFAYGPRLLTSDGELLNEISYFLHFFPVSYVKETLLPAMNKSLTNEITFEEFLCFLGLFYSMEVQKLPERKMYWGMDESGLFK